MRQSCQANVLCVERRDGLVEFVLSHPVDAHSIPGRSDGAIPAACHLDEIQHVIGLAVVTLALVHGVAEWVLAVRWHFHREVAFKKTVTENPQAGGTSCRTA